MDPITPIANINTGIRNNMTPIKKELTNAQKGKYRRYNAIKANLNARGSTLSKQQKYLAKLDSARQKNGENAYKNLIPKLEAEWNAEKSKTKTMKAINGMNMGPKKTVKTVKMTKTKKNDKPVMSDEEQLAILQKRIAMKSDAETLYRNVYGKNATNATRNKTKLNSIISMMSQGKNANAIKANIKAKRNATTKKRMNTIASKKVVTTNAYNPFNDDIVEPIPDQTPVDIDRNPFNNF